MECPSVCWVEPDLVGRPEPAVDVLREELVTVTTVEVAQTAWGPDVLGLCKKAILPLVCLGSTVQFRSSKCTGLTSNEGLEVLILGLVFKADEVHAPLSAVVPSVEPIPLSVSGLRVSPWKPVVAPVVLVGTLTAQSWKFIILALQNLILKVFFRATSVRPKTL